MIYIIEQTDGFAVKYENRTLTYVLKGRVTEEMLLNVIDAVEKVAETNAYARGYDTGYDDGWDKACEWVDEKVS